MNRNSIIFDLDGTLANVEKRRKLLQDRPYNWDAFFSQMEDDEPNIPIKDLFITLEQTKKFYMFIVTGRPEKYRYETIRWLNKYGLTFSHLYMRKDGDKRADNVIKKEILEVILEKGFNVNFTVDDRDSVVEMWRSMGITCLQCNRGNF